MGDQPLANYTTSVGAAKTAAECQTMLARYGASRIAIDYDNGRPTGLTFAITDIGIFTLPVDTQAVLEVMKLQGRRRIIPPRYATHEQSERVGWRIIKDWLRAQLALIDTRMVSLSDVMLPYLNVGDGKTLREAYAARELEAKQ